MATLTKTDIAALSLDERLALLDNLWESFEDAPEPLPPPDWHGEILEKRLAAAELAPEATISWEEARARSWLRSGCAKSRLEAYADADQISLLLRSARGRADCGEIYAQSR